MKREQSENNLIPNDELSAEGAKRTIFHFILGLSAAMECEQSVNCRQELRFFALI